MRRRKGRVGEREGTADLGRRGRAGGEKMGGREGETEEQKQKQFPSMISASLC